MNSDEIFDKIEEIAATSSKLGKEDLIRAASISENFKNVLQAGLNPFLTYGMAKLPPRGADSPEGDVFDSVTWDMLDKMANRELTGNAAKEEVQGQLKKLSSKSAELLARIITKDLRGGFSESTVNKAIPNFIVTFDCMLAHKFEASRVKTWPQIVEPKLDGVRVLSFVNLDNQSVFFFSRSGKEFTTFEHLKKPILDMVMMAHVKMTRAGRDGAASDLVNVVFDGEIVSGSFNKTVGDVRRKSEQAMDAEFHVFDIIKLSEFKSEGKGGCAIAGDYKYRRKFLEEVTDCVVGSAPIKIIQKYVVGSEAEVHHIYESVRARGLEGLIVKDPDGLYHRRRNHGWMKIKAEESEDLTVFTVIEGTGKYVGQMGAIVVDYKGVRVNVGSGFSDEQRIEFWQAFMRDAERSTNGVGGVGGPGEVLGRIVEVEYHEVTPDGSLRHPRFVRFRDTLSHGEKE